MSSLIETPHRTPQRIVTGHFHEKTGYYAFRTHGTQDWLVIYTVDGAGRFGLGKSGGGKTDGEIVVGPGDIVLIPPGTLHDYGVHPDAAQWELLWAHFHPRPEWQPWLNWPRAAKHPSKLMRLSVSYLPTRKRVETALLKMHRRSMSPSRLRTSLAMNALEEAILWCDTQSPAANSIDSDPRIVQAQEYLCQNLRQTVSLDDLAGEIGLSVSRLSFLFRKQTGMTPQRYYESQRMERARQLLEITAMPIKQIAGEVGFSNPFYFTLRFKARTGKSPRAYRAAQITGRFAVK